jgi:expansin (peptidoglycan-binding protein)
VPFQFFGRMLFTTTATATGTGTAGGAQILDPLIRRKNEMISDDSPIVRYCYCYCCCCCC